MTAMTDSPQRLYLMQVAFAPPPVHVPIVCYLIQTGDGRNILVDSGFLVNIHSLQLPPGYPTPVLGSNVIEQLALLGLRPDDIDLLICTHFDLDHSGHHGAHGVRNEITSSTWGQELPSTRYQNEGREKR